MMTTLGKEKRYYEKKWKEWERHVETVAQASSGLLPTWSDLAPRFHRRRCGASGR